MPCAAAPKAAATPAASIARPRKLPDADPWAAAAYPSRAPSTNASPASTTFVATVVGSVMPAQRGTAFSSLVIEVRVVQDGAEEGDMVTVPVAPEALVGIIAS